MCSRISFHCPPERKHLSLLKYDTPRYLQNWRVSLEINVPSCLRTPLNFPCKRRLWSHRIVKTKARDDKNNSSVWIFIGLKLNEIYLTTRRDMIRELKCFLYYLLGIFFAVAIPYKQTF